MQSLTKKKTNSSQVFPTLKKYETSLTNPLQDNAGMRKIKLLKMILTDLFISLESWHKAEEICQ